MWRRRDRPAREPSDDEIARSVLAIYQRFEASGGVQHYRTAFLFFQAAGAYAWIADEDGDIPSFVVVTVEVGGDQPDGVGVETADSLEVARSVCVKWVGEPRLVDWGQLSRPVATAFFNALREPTVAEFDDRFGTT